MVFWSYPPTPKQLCISAVVFITGATLIAFGAHLSQLPFLLYRTFKSFFVMPPSSVRVRYSNLCNRQQHVSSAEDTPSSSVHLSHEYNLALHTNSYSEIWSRIHRTRSSYIEIESHEEQIVSNTVLIPTRERVQEALQNTTPNNSTPLVAAYFDHSVRTSHMCLLLHESIIRARVIYNDIHKIVDCFPLDSDAHSLTETQCEWAFNAFLQFDRFFFFLKVSNLIDLITLFLNLGRRAYVIYVSVFFSLINKFTKSLGNLVLGHDEFAVLRLAQLLVLSGNKERERTNLSQLNAAARGTFVVHDLDTIDRLVDRLHSSVEGDKFLVRLGLERGRDRHPIHEVAKQLKKNQGSFLIQLVDLEEHICLCFASINRARCQLLEELRLHQSHSC